MARIARIIVPDLPHHVTQRGNRRQMLFVEKGDYARYRDLLAERCRETGLSRAVGEAHRRYTAFFKARDREHERISPTLAFTPQNRLLEPFQAVEP